MRFLLGEEEEKAWKFIRKAVLVAKKATCLRAKCGTVIVKNGKVIGKGYNSPPNNLESQRRCNRKYELSRSFKSDKTCCVHAEQRAIINALKKYPEKLKGSRLYFIRLNEKDKPQKSGKPYCTICSKMALDTGIKEFVLWHKEGICVYETEEYNNLSFAYKEEPLQ